MVWTGLGSKPSSASSSLSKLYSFSVSLSVKCEYWFLIRKVFLKIIGDDIGKTLYGETDYMLGT